MADLKQFADPNHNARVDDGHRFFTAGDHGEEMYVVLSGSVDIVLRGKVLETVHPGGIFGELAIIDHRERSAEVIARGPTEVSVIDPGRFRFLVRHDPDFALEVMRIMAERLRRVDELI